MKIIIIIVCILLVNLGCSAVHETTAAKLNKQEVKDKKKALKVAEEEQQYLRTGNLLDSMNFVLEAEFLSNQRGNRMFVNSSLNFIKVDSVYSVIQIGRNVGIGYNGVGGVTAEGKITKWKMSRNDKRKTFSVQMGVMTTIGIYDVFMDVNLSGRATAYLTGLQHGRLVFDGQIVRPELSRIYKGHSL